MTADAPSIPAESLLRHRAFVQSLARSLVRDEHAAQDLVQETWLEALRHPPRSAAALPAWLARVVRTRAQNAARGAVRRASREAIAAREEADESEVRLSEQVAMQHKVVEAVLGLKEPYKSVVLLRYYEGLSPSAIAARRGAPEGTVRAQISRAHDLLRERLDAEFGGSRKAWIVTLLEFTRPPVTFLLSAKAIAAITCVAAAVVAGIFWFAPHGGRAPDAVPVQVTSPVDANFPRDSDGIGAVPAPSERTEVASEAKPARDQQEQTIAAADDWAIHGTFVDSDGRPAAKATLCLFSPPEHGAPPVLEKQTRLDDEGKFRIKLGSGANRLLTVVRAGSIPPTVAVNFGSAREIDLGTLKLGSGNSLSGTVIDASTGAGMSNAMISVRTRNGEFASCGPDNLSWFDDRFCFSSPQTSSDGEGGFAIAGLEKGAYLLYVSPPGLGCSMSSVEGDWFDVQAPSTNLALEFRAPRLVFTVTARGQAVARAAVNLLPTIEGSESRPFRPMTCHTDDEGHVVCAVPEAIDLEVEVSASGFASRTYSIQSPGSGGILPQNVALEPGPAPGRLELEITDPPDPAAKSISLGFFDLERPKDESPLFTRREKWKPGPFEFADLPTKRYRVELHVAEDFNFYYETCYVPLSFELDIRPGETVHAQQALQLGGRIRVRVRDVEGKSLGAGVWFKDPAGVPLSVTFVQFVPEANMNYMGTWQPHMTQAHPEKFVNVQPAFPEGTYSVEVKMEGFASRTESFHLDKGKTTDLDFTLDPERR